MNKQKILSILKNIAAVIVIAAMFVVIFYQNRDRDIFKFGREESSKFISSSVEGNEEFSAGDIGNVGDRVAFLTTTSYTLLDEKGEGDSIKIALTEPVLHSEGNYAVCYSSESLELTIFKNTEKIYSVKAESKLFSAKVNKNGYLFIATEKDGYNCECMVYNRNGEAIFKWDVSKSEFLDGDVSNSNNAIAISLASAGNKKLVGELVLVDVTEAKVIKKETFDSQIFYSVNFNNNDTYTALGNESLSYFNSDGTKKWSYDFSGNALMQADVSNHDRMILAFADSRGIIEGNSTNIKIINRIGRVTKEITFESVITDIALNDECIALAFGNEVYILNEKLREIKQVKSNYKIKKLALFENSRNVFVLGAPGGEILE